MRCRLARCCRPRHQHACGGCKLVISSCRSCGGCVTACAPACAPVMQNVWVPSGRSTPSSVHGLLLSAQAGSLHLHRDPVVLLKPTLAHRSRSVNWFLHQQEYEYTVQLCRQEQRTRTIQSRENIVSGSKDTIPVQLCRQETRTRTGSRFSEYVTSSSKLRIPIELPPGTTNSHHPGMPERDDSARVRISSATLPPGTTNSHHPGLRERDQSARVRVILSSSAARNNELVPSRSARRDFQQEYEYPVRLSEPKPAPVP